MASKNVRGSSNRKDSTYQIQNQDSFGVRDKVKKQVKNVVIVTTTRLKFQGVARTNESVFLAYNPLNNSENTKIKDNNSVGSAITKIEKASSTHDYAGNSRTKKGVDKAVSGVMRFVWTKLAGATRVAKHRIKANAVQATPRVTSVLRTGWSKAILAWKAMTTWA